MLTAGYTVRHFRLFDYFKQEWIEEPSTSDWGYIDGYVVVDGKVNAVLVRLNQAPVLKELDELIISGGFGL